MASLKSDKAIHKSKEFADLRSLRYGNLRRTLIFGGIILALALVTVAFVHLLSSGGIQESLQQLESAQSEWSVNLANQYRESRSWLSRHGIRSEAVVYDDLSHLIFSFVLMLDADSNPSTFSRILIGISTGLLRASFIVIASFRLWILAIILAAIWGLTSRKVHKESDFLGQSGNDRFFYSGIRADLAGIVEEGGPATYLKGLACPETKSVTEAKLSSLGKILEHYGALNNTNLALSAIILAHEETPAYVAPHGEDAKLLDSFTGAGLLANVEEILQQLLELHSSYRSSIGAADTESSLAAIGVDSGQYAELLKIGTNRVLTATLKQELASIPADQIATLILAFEAGKVMAYGFDSGRWLRKSNFPQLCARAILHSVVAFAEEYDFSTRQELRRALVYGSRKSAFGPVRFPIDLSLKSRAMRQWVELLMACPHELNAVTDEVELFGMVCELKSGWDNTLIEAISNNEEQVIQGIYSTMTGLFFMPLANVVSVIRRFTDIAELHRLSELVAVVSRRQAEFIEAQEVQSTDGDAVIIPSYEKIFAPLANEDLNALAEYHGLNVDDIRDWCTFRVILNSFGWLARRVGDYSVPESSIIFAVLKASDGGPDYNHLGLLGKKGMVAFRASRLMEHFGLTWQDKFLQVESASMAENPQDFDKRMNGIEDDDEEFQDIAVG